MAPPKIPYSKKKKSARYYADNPKAAKKKNATTHANNQKSERKTKMKESTAARRAAKKRGVNLKNKDMAHTKSGIRPKDSSANRSSKTDSAGDKRARGGKKKK